MQGKALYLQEDVEAVWSEATVTLTRFISSEPGLRGELPASGA
jgi:hypothetical protein